MPRARPSMASVPRGGFLACIGAWTAALHVAQVVLVVAVGGGVDLTPVVGSALVWSGLALWGLRRGGRTTSAELAAVVSCGAVAITVDGILLEVPGTPELVCAGLVALLLAVTASCSGAAALLGAAAVLACQVVLLLASLGPSPVAVYTAVGVALTSGGVGLLVRWQKQDLQALVESTRETARLDPVTGLLNRRGMAERFAEVRWEAPEGHRAAAVVLDLDHFKRINDDHGHDAGDEVLVAVAGVLRSRARRSDLAVRLGGEELAWIGAWPSAEAAVEAAEGVRRAVAAARGPQGLAVTTSIGVAFSTDATHAAADAEVLSRLLVRADAALYEAKRTGRDRVVLAPTAGRGEDAPHDGAPAPRVRDGGSGGASAALAADGSGAGQRA